MTASATTTRMSWMRNSCRPPHVAYYCCVLRPGHEDTRAGSVQRNHSVAARAGSVSLHPPTLAVLSALLAHTHTQQRFSQNKNARLHHHCQWQRQHNSKHHHHGHLRPANIAHHHDEVLAYRGAATDLRNGHTWLGLSRLSANTPSRVSFESGRFLSAGLILTTTGIRNQSCGCACSLFSGAVHRLGLVCEPHLALARAASAAGVSAAWRHSRPRCCNATRSSRLKPAHAQAAACAPPPSEGNTECVPTRMGR